MEERNKAYGEENNLPADCGMHLRVMHIMQWGKGRKKNGRGKN